MFKHLTMAEIEADWTALGDSPTDNGTVETIVARPATDERIVLAQGAFDITIGLVGDNWQTRGSRHTADGQALRDAQITIMSSRVLKAIAPDRDQWKWAGDQLIVDLDLSADNLPAGQRLAIGTVVLEITAQPHTGCAKFTERFGSDAIRFVNSKEGRPARRRGIYARVIQNGTIRVGDTVVKLAVNTESLVPSTTEFINA